MLIRRGLLAELRERGVAVALTHVAENLIVGPVLLHDQEHMLDRGWVTNTRRDRDCRRLSALGVLDIVPAPAVLRKHRGRVARDVNVARKGEPRQRCGGAVRVVAAHRYRSLSLVGRYGRAARVD